MNKYFFIVVSTILVYFSSCEKSFGIEASFGVETTLTIEAGQASDSIYRDQKLLLQEMELRNQIVDVKEYKEVCTITFQDGRKARFSESIFPLIKAGGDSKWTISGIESGIGIRKDEHGQMMLPPLSIEEDGFWHLDSLHTDLLAEKYLEFLATDGGDSLNIKGFLISDEYLYIYLSDDSIRTYSILRERFYVVPDYWIEHLVEKEKMGEAAIREAGDSCAVFAFFTDAHWGYNFKHSAALLRHITEFTPVSDVFFGGDVITNFSNNTVAPMQLGLDFQASYSFLGPHFYCVYGNHDNNSAGQPSRTEVHLSEEMVIEYLQSQMTELDKKEGYNFYFDDPGSKTRFIGLDTGRYNNSVFRTVAPVTARFLIDALSGVPEGWHVIVVSHIWAEYKKSEGVEMSVFTPFYNSFLNIIHDYNARRNGTFTYKNESVEYDFTSSLGHVECCVGGHTHLNSTLFSKDVLPVILVGKDSMKRNNHPGIEGTLKEQCIALFVFDYKQRKLDLFFVGYGKDQTIGLPAFD